jgi:hypothetical protein
MNKIFGVIALILVGYFGRMAVEIRIPRGTTRSVPIEWASGAIGQYSLSDFDVIKLVDNEIAIVRNNPKYVEFIDRSTERLLNRKLGYEEVFFSAQPIETGVEYERRTRILAGVRTKTKKFIQGVDVLDSKNNKIDLLRQGWGEYIAACPARDLPSGTYKVRVYLKDTAKDIKDKSRNFSVEWDFRVNAENPNAWQNSCSESSMIKPVIQK